MNKICTSIEQSQRLIELGIDIKTADMFWDMAEPDKRRKPIVGPISDYFDMEDWAVPAWSLTALLNLIQDNIKIEKTLFDQSDMFTYSIIGDAYEYHSHEHENLVDAAFEMVCWLLETGEI